MAAKFLIFAVLVIVAVATKVRAAPAMGDDLPPNVLKNAVWAPAEGYQAKACVLSNCQSFCLSNGWILGSCWYGWCYCYRFP